MLEQALLREQVQAFLASETQARQAYTRATETADNPQLREQLEQLGKDTQRHIRLTQQLLEILESNRLRNDRAGLRGVQDEKEDCRMEPSFRTTILLESVTPRNPARSLRRRIVLQRKKASRWVPFTRSPSAAGRCR